MGDEQTSRGTGGEIHDLHEQASRKGTLNVLNYEHRPRGYKKHSCSTQLSTKFILLINVKMPTIVGILTFITMINATSDRLKARNFFIYLYFSFYEQLKFRDQLS